MLRVERQERIIQLAAANSEAPYFRRVGRTGGRYRSLELQVAQFQPEWTRAEGGLERFDRLLAICERETIVPIPQDRCRYIIQSGRVAIQLGNRLPDTLEANEMFGEMAMVDPAPRSATAIATTDVRLVRLSKKQFLELIRWTLGVPSAPTQIFSGTRLFSAATRILVDAMEASPVRRFWHDGHRLNFTYRPSLEEHQILLLPREPSPLKTLKVGDEL